MSTPFVAEIRIFPYNFAPTGWAMCDGQLLPISQNTALFSLLGTYYGGDGKSTFALPDFRGRFPTHHGQGQGLSERFLGEMAGQEFVTLLSSEMPQHVHTLRAGDGTAAVIDPLGNFLGKSPARGYSSVAGLAAHAAMIDPAGAGLPHNNLSPYLVLTFCIALQGVFPPRS